MSTICLRLNFSRASISTKFAYFWTDTSYVSIHNNIAILLFGFRFMNIDTHHVNLPLRLCRFFAPLLPAPHIVLKSHRVFFTLDDTDCHIPAFDDRI
jgi:hypothetical protein